MTTETILVDTSRMVLRSVAFGGGTRGSTGCLTLALVAVCLVALLSPGPLLAEIHPSHGPSPKPSEILGVSVPKTVTSTGAVPIATFSFLSGGKAPDAKAAPAKTIVDDDSWISNPKGRRGTILVLYKTRDPNHKGLVTLYTGYLREAGYGWDAEDVESYFSEDPDTSEYAGIMTCFESNSMVSADKYPLWLDKQLEAGKKIAVIGMYGAFQGLLPKKDGTYVESNEPSLSANTFFWPFGLEFFPAFSNKKGTLKITRKNGRFAQFQAPITTTDVEKTGYQLFRSVHPANKVHLAVSRSDLRNSESAFIVHTPFGGMILQGYTPFWDPGRIDPKTGAKGMVVQRTDMAAFLKLCFDGRAPAVPHYDVQTHDELVKRHPLPRKTEPPDPWVSLPNESKRRVLALYKREELKLTNKSLSSPILERNPFRNRADIVLSALGLVTDYRAVEDGLPTDVEMQRYLGIVTWYSTPFMPDAKGYNEWVLKQIKAGRKLIILQEHGATIDARLQTTAANAHAVFRALGLDFGPLKLARFERFPKIKTLDRSMIGFEHPIDMKEVSYRQQYVSYDPANKVHLSVEDYYSGAVDLVVTAPNGGVALENSEFFFPGGDVERINLVREALAGRLMPEKAEEPTLGAWIVNPYRFFSTALGLKDEPAADYSSMNGARLFYAHIDADGLESLSRIDGTFFAGRYITDEVLKKYPLVPHTVSVISRSVERGGNRYYHPQIELAREVFRLPNVEVASHSSTHPFDWVEGDPYVTNPKSYPWKIAYKQQNFVDEIWGSKLFIEANLAPPDKRMDILLWTGATNPDERPLEVCWKAGIHNLNGGDPVFDTEHPTVAGLCPVGTPFGSKLYGPFRQCHTSARNDYIYMLFLLGDWDGQKKVIDHFARTESPNRILPMNLYYHFYSGLKWESINALKYVLDKVVAMEPAMVFASQYCKIAEDFYRTNIQRDGAAWLVSNQGDLRQVRFSRLVHVDLLASEGVVGYSHDRGQTYVHLDGRPTRRIVLTSAPVVAPRIDRCTWFLDRGKVSAGRLDLDARGMGHMAATFAGLSGSNWRVTLSDAQGTAVFDRTLCPDGQGKITVQTDRPGPFARYRLVISRI